MPKPSHLQLSDLRGFRSLASDAIAGLTDLVEAMHHTIASTPGVLSEPTRGKTGGITGLVYRSIRGVNQAVGAGIDTLLGVCGALIAERPSSQEREAVLAALNGVLGDYLVETANPLAISMSVRVAGRAITISRAALTEAFPHPGHKIVILVHGLCMNDLQWRRDGHDHGAAIARDLGFTPVYVHYNTGRHVSTNGREFADLMESLLREWPHPVDRLAIVGHSMGGLVARSALHYAALSSHDWPRRLDDLVCLGTPHFGAPLARIGAWVDFLVGISPYTAPFGRLGNVRSAGIKDMRRANLRDEDWQANNSGNERTALPAPQLPRNVRLYAIAASKQKGPGAAAARIPGDGLVPVNSALGRHRDPALSLRLPEAHCWVGYGMGHFDLLSRMEVYERIKDWLERD